MLTRLVLYQLDEEDFLPGKTSESIYFKASLQSLMFLWLVYLWIMICCFKKGSEMARTLIRIIAHHKLYNPLDTLKTGTYNSSKHSPYTTSYFAVAILYIWPKYRRRNMKKYYRKWNHLQYCLYNNQEDINYINIRMYERESVCVCILSFFSIL